MAACEADAASGSLPALPSHVRAFLTGPLAATLDEPDEGPYADNAAYLRTLEALTTLQVVGYKMASECQQRVLSFASRDFGDATAAGVLRAMETLPIVRAWVLKLRTRLEVRGALPLVDSGLPPRLVRTCDVYELSKVERQLFGAMLMMRTTLAFATVKLNSSVGYSASAYGNGSKASVTLSSILDVSMLDVATFQKAERRHVKQGVVLPAGHVLADIPALQQEAVLLLLNLPLTESQLFNIEKTDLMRYPTPKDSNPRLASRPA